MKLAKITVPDKGELDRAEVIEILIISGDYIQQEDSIIRLESDKATMEVPALTAGRVSKILVKIGDWVTYGSVILELEINTTSQFYCTMGNQESFNFTELTSKHMPDTELETII